MKRYVSGNLLMTQSYSNKVGNTGLFMFIYDRANKDNARLIMPHERSQKIYQETRESVKAHFLDNGYVSENWSGFVELRGHIVANERQDNVVQGIGSAIADNAAHG